MTATANTVESQARSAAQIVLAGRVQGIGLRPSIARFAEKLSLVGYVINSLDGVEVHVEGPADDVDQFQRDLGTHLPAAVELSSVQSVRVELLGCKTFAVRQAVRPSSDHDAAGWSTPVPSDIVACDKCLAEVHNATNRRHAYALTSCTDCGPRYSIIKRMPYERAQTSMSGFPLCVACRREYETGSDRRFHAQTNACPNCGPHIWLRDDKDRIVAHQTDAVRAAASSIVDGRIVALRGLGGYQLLVDATSEEAVQRIRERKQRYGKPLAVMVASLDEAEALATLDEGERALLRSPAGPIVVAAIREDAVLASSVTAGLNSIGLMLPTTPLHWLLLDALKRPLVCTSANTEGNPLVYQPDVASHDMRHLADVMLEHSRPIHRPVDDSVVRVMAGESATIRMARGFAPLPLNVDCDQPLVALGGQQKTSIALSSGAQAVLGPHIGDLNTVAARERFVEQVGALSEFYGVGNGQFVCDRHPEYFTTVWAEGQAGRPLRVQHHHAHVVAGMLERGWLDRQVLGVSYDGTGYGADGTIWGGEFLLATATGFERIGSLRPFPLPGSERAIREPWRVAASLVREAAGDEEAARLVFRAGDAQSLLPILRNPRLSISTTSVGRLFDGVATLVLGIEHCQFEGQAAMLLESACDVTASGRYDMAIEGAAIKRLDWRALVRQVLRDRAVGVSPGVMAMRFHRGLASATFNLCRIHSSLPVVLGGGVFQNRVLVELLADRFATTNQPLGLPGMIPTNDGGLAAGQLAVAAALTQQRKTDSCV